DGERFVERQLLIVSVAEPIREQSTGFICPGCFAEAFGREGAKLDVRVERPSEPREIATGDCLGNRGDGRGRRRDSRRCGHWIPPFSAPWRGPVTVACGAVA